MGKRTGEKISEIKESLKTFGKPDDLNEHNKVCFNWNMTKAGKEKKSFVQCEFLSADITIPGPIQKSGGVTITALRN